MSTSSPSDAVRKRDALRQRVVRQVLAGLTQAEAARRHGVPLRTVAHWMALHRAGGEAALRAARPGRKPRVLPDAALRDELLDRVACYRPVDLGLGGPVWTGAALAALVGSVLGAPLSAALAQRWLLPARRGAAEPQPLQRLRDERLADLVGLVYEGALAAVPWAPWLERLRRILRANWATLIVTPGAPEADALLINAGPDGATLLRDPYATYEVYSRDPFMDLPGDRMLGIEDVVDEAAWYASDFYRRFVAVHGVRYQIGADLRAEDGTECRLRLSRPLQGGRFSRADRAVCERWLPHLRRAVALLGRLARVESEREAYAGAVERLQIGTLLMDEHGQVLSANGAARALLDAQDGSGLHDGRLVLGRPAEQRELARLVQAALQARAGAPTAPASWAMSVQRRGGGTLGIALRPLPLRAAAGRAGQPALALYLSDAERRPSASNAALRRLFELSAAEAALAACLADGATLDAAAVRLGISRHTARTHLRALFDKTGVRRQAQLVRLLLGPAATLG